MKSYVILGCGHSLPDLFDIISARGATVEKIVCPDLAAVPIGQSHAAVPIQSLETFVARPDETYLCGLTGKEALEFNRGLKGKADISYATLIHPGAIISPTAQISSGSVISARAIIASNVEIGKNCFIGQGAIFGHDTTLADYAEIRSGANLAGHIKIGEGALIGMGATVIEDVAIGRYARIDPGAVVLKNVPPKTTAGGVPAVIKQN